MPDKYTLDIIRKQHVVPGTISIVGTNGLACEHVGGLFGYGFSDELATKILTVLNHFDGPEVMNDPNWFDIFNLDAELHQVQFDEGMKKQEFDVMCLNGEAIGYTLRDNLALLYAITILNGAHLMRYADWLAGYENAHAYA